MGTPIYDCDEARRPPEPSSDDDPPGGIERFVYPDRPESITDDSAVLSYVEDYERAYRLNDIYRKYRDRLGNAALDIRDVRPFEAPEGAAIVRLEYLYSHRVERSRGTEYYDSPTVYVSYYVDESAVVRAAGTGNQEGEAELDPNPLDVRSPVECF